MPIKDVNISGLCYTLECKEEDVLELEKIIEDINDELGEIKYSSKDKYYDLTVKLISLLIKKKQHLNEINRRISECILKLDLS